MNQHVLLFLMKQNRVAVQQDCHPKSVDFDGFLWYVIALRDSLSSQFFEHKEYGKKTQLSMHLWLWVTHHMLGIWEELISKQVTFNVLQASYSKLSCTDNC